MNGNQEKHCVKRAPLPGRFLDAQGNTLFGAELAMVPDQAFMEPVACPQECPGAVAEQVKILGVTMPHLFDRIVCGMSEVPSIEQNTLQTS